MAKFCVHCGHEVNENAAVCLNCGCAVQGTYVYQSGQAVSKNIVETVSQRLQTNGIIWIVIAAIQIILGIAVNWAFLIVGVLNLISAIQDINFSKSFSGYPVGIVAKVQPLVGPIITLIYNLILGGIIGVAGSIYYFVAIRGFVLENRQAFLDIENQQNPVCS